MSEEDRMEMEGIFFLLDAALATLRKSKERLSRSRIALDQILGEQRQLVDSRGCWREVRYPPLRMIANKDIVIIPIEQAHVTEWRWEGPIDVV